MVQSTEKLYKIFKLEAELNYQNKAVVGGLEKFTDSWVGEARAEGINEALIQQVSKIMKNYTNLPIEQRANALKEIGQILDVAGIKHLPDSTEIQVQPMEPEKQETQRPAPQKPTEKKSRGTATRRQSTPAPLPISDTLQGLRAPTTIIRGIGDKQAELLSKLGLNSVEDMLYNFPHRYDDYSQMKLIQDLKFGEEVTILAYVNSVKTFKTPNSNRKITQAIVSDSTGAIQLMWFNQEYQMRYLRKDMFLSISGKVEQYLGRLVMYHPVYEQIEKEQLNTNRIVPVYSLTAKLSQRWLRRTMHNVVSYWAPKIPDFITEHILADAELMDLSTALMQIHFPEDKSNLSKARYRIAFDEHFLLKLGFLRQRQEWISPESRIYEVDDTWLAEQTTRLPFELTGAQQKALADIRQDLAAGHPMNRLLQGDVGSGKTIVAALGMGIVVQNGAQAAFMAPTSILAEQHYASLKRLLASDTEDAYIHENEIRLLIGDTPNSEREEILAGLADGTVKILVGTHALIEGPVVFKDLQMVVVDEQHRFGIAQRAALREKGENPHLLVMTATPIPRSLALTIYGDLDLSVMDEMPVGRQPVSTHILYPTERERVYTLIKAQVKDGHQAFIIYPLVEQGENEERKAAVEEQERLQKDVFPHLRVGLLHGRLRPEEKDTVMKHFRDKELDILVSTSVVEVGVDIPNATVMLIEGADRFGLAQLHQFRGRVGRGQDQSYCFLIPETKDAAENERLLAMKSTNDGFVLAEHDLAQRGPGEFLGTRQSGYENLRLAKLTDIHLIEKAGQYAKQVFDNDPELSSPEHQLMLNALNHFWLGGEGDLS
ncbi:MAG: ATP-dependent DNA helicase RecG [Anaerolineaceae bacterium]|nr:ATP-dependent DNA helicase RecG [Anaerolineaceae bacterium]